MTANLLSRLQGLTAPDREVDALIMAWSENRTVRYEDGNLLAKSKQAPYDECVLGWVDPGKHSRNFTPQSESQPAYTASLDATVALCERVLPGWAWYIEKIEGIDTREHVSEADIWLPGQRTQGLKKERFRAGAATPAIALLIAILTALEARDAS